MSEGVLDVASVWESLHESIRRALPEEVHVEHEARTAVAYVQIDRSQIDHVMLNLALNARDAMDGKGNLLLSLDMTALTPRGARTLGLEPGPHAVLRVKDDGCGMDAMTLDRAFEPFFTTKEQGRGTGLGLSTVHGIVMRHHGMVRIESAPGRGTTVNVYLPASTVPPCETAPVSDEIDPTANMPPSRIAIVEDDAKLRAMLAATLEAEGFEVLAPATSVAALDLLTDPRVSVDALVTDIGLPEVSGHELARHVRRRFPDLPILFISGYGEEALDADWRDREGVRFLVKPFERGALLRSLAKLLHRAAHTTV